jgi:urease accessory protein
VRTADGSLCLMMLNSGGGILGGDRLSTRAHLGEEASAVLITASASKVYRAAGAPASQQISITLGPGATIEFLPDHLIPHPGARLYQSVRVQMAPGSRAILYDAIAAGRIGRGERWRFGELNSEIVVTRGAAPLYLNRSRIIPEENDPDRLGVAEGFNYLASFVIAGENDSDWASLSTELDRALQKSPGVSGGASQLAGGGCSVRFMTYGAEDLKLLTSMLWGIARRGILKREPFNLRKF